MKVAIRLGNDVKLDAMGLKTDVSGGLNIRQEPEKPLAGNGQLVLTNGRFKAYGQNLIIKEGRISSPVRWIGRSSTSKPTGIPIPSRVR